MLPQFFHLGQTWHIESGAALAALSDFANDLAIVQAGGKWSDTGAMQRKAASNVSFEKTAGGRIAFVALEGVMRMSDGLCSKGIQSLSNEIRTMSADHTVSAIVIEANTGGGEAISGQELSNAISESSKPVLFYAHFLASAGVMASLGADEIYASGPQTEVGSIGVKATVDNEMVAWFSQNFTDYYADSSENKNEEFRALQMGDPSKIIAALNKSDAIFMAEVKKNLNLKGDAETIKETLSGRMFFAEDAKKRGLIDGIKNKAEVIARAEQLAKQYSKSGRPKKGKKMANILAGTILGNALGIKEADEDAATLEMVQTKFTELEASTTDLTAKLAEAGTAKTAAELNAAALQARVAELEALNVTLSEKVLSVNSQSETLTGQVATLETEKKNLSTQLAALTLKSTAISTAPNEITDSKVIESAAKKSFGGSVEVK